MTSFVKFLLILATSSIKFLFAPPLSYGFGFGFLQTWAFTSVGGVLGVLFFFMLSKILINIYVKFYRTTVREKILQLAGRIGKRHIAERYLPKQSRVFTRQNKIIAWIRSRLGFFGVIVLAPILFSVPLGTFIVMRLYSGKKYLPVYLSASVVAWSLVISTSIALF